jgi:hypothetical protein
MRSRRLPLMNLLGAISVAVVYLVAPAAGQRPAAQAATGAQAKTSQKAYKAPRTPDGQPDLQGVWNFSTATPLERPNQFGTKSILNDDEAEEFERTEAERLDHDRNPPADIVGNYNEFWYDGNKKVVGTKRTSLIIDPPDGRLPAPTPEAQKKVEAVNAARRGTGRHEPTPGGWVEDLGPGGLQVRCIMGFNSGPPMTPAAYNQNVQLFQTKTHVVILNEMIHNARIVPIDGRAQATGIPQWVGHSRGRWEGETLVVETTKFKRETAFLNGRTTADLHLTERFTRTGEDTLIYQFTVNDPKVFTRPWTAEIAMSSTDQPMYEYACHEGNYGLENILSGASHRDKAPAAKTSGR